MEKIANTSTHVVRSLITYWIAIIFFLLPAFDSTAGQPDSGYREAPIKIEAWMTAPFEPDLVEEPLELETWMTEPFEVGFKEEPLEVEAWMTAPFEIHSVEDPLEATTFDHFRKNDQETDSRDPMCRN